MLGLAWASAMFGLLQIKGLAKLSRALLGLALVRAYLDLLVCGNACWWRGGGLGRSSPMRESELGWAIVRPLVEM